ncbi:zinc finger protein-domain-containing protein [Coniochaeta sp. 2T2.1]|nr:zinc finger protein-domain-containing protein [Coniochaeta sp. 2T2.1]
MANPPPSASAIAVDALATERLSRYIDDLDNIDELERRYDDFESRGPAYTLRLVLGSPAKRYGWEWYNQVSDLQNALRYAETVARVPPDSRAIGYRKIGFGQCGLVIQRPGRDFVVKIARPAFQGALWSDFMAHLHVHHGFESQRIPVDIRVPKVFTFVNDNNSDWWQYHRGLLQEHEGFPLPSAALISQRILPLPKIAREALISLYCPPALQAAAMADRSNRDCLARIYLGRRRPENARLAPNFSLRNFNLCLDQMLDLKLPVNYYASAMGEALAVIHWQANVDGYDIEFVLGTDELPADSPEQPVRTRLTSVEAEGRAPIISTTAIPLDTTVPAEIQERKLQASMWVLDFNLCNRWNEWIGWQQPDVLVEQLVLAFFENDPYYPRPLMEGELEQSIWNSFHTSYLDKAIEILHAAGKDVRLRHLPGMFADACIARERAKIEADSGHGHRDLKG